MTERTFQGNPVCPHCGQFKPRGLKAHRKCEAQAAFAAAANLPLPNRRKPRAPSERMQDAIDQQHRNDIALATMSDADYEEYLSMDGVHWGQHPWPCLSCNADYECDRERAF